MGGARASFWVGPRHAYLMRTTGAKWASYQSVKRVYTVNPVYRPKELRQLSFGPKNELNRLFANLHESLATRVSDSQGQNQATCREGFMAHKQLHFGVSTESTRTIPLEVLSAAHNGGLHVR